MKNTFFTFIILAVVLASCSSNKGRIYFEGIKRSPEETYKISNYTAPTIQSGDMLSLSVTSLDDRGSAQFNTSSNSDDKGSGGGSSSGFLVDGNGEILLPLVHKIKVGGFTLVEAQAIVKKAIAGYLKEPEVTLKFTNLKVSILGDVSEPGVYNITDERFPITRAISLAGDLTTTASLNNLLLVREVDGKRKYVNIDLTSPKIFDSPYYYLRNNDVLYVEPTKSKFTTSQNSTLRILPISISALSLIISTYQLTKK